MSNQYPQHPGGAPEPTGPAGGPPRYTQTGDQYGAGRPDVATAPPELQRLLTLTLVSAGLYLLSQLVSLFTADAASTADALQEQGLSAAEAASLAEQTAGVAMITSIAVIVVALVVYALVYVFLRKGRNWARVLGIVLAILSTLGVLLGLVTTALVGLSGLGVVGLLLGLVLVVVNVLWLVTAFKAPVKEWFTPRRMV